MRRKILLNVSGLSECYKGSISGRAPLHQNELEILQSHFIISNLNRRSAKNEKAAILPWG
jgi:hypothetical protein